MNVPNHVAIIMDGNRRFSKKLLMKPWKGHEWGAKKVESVLEWCKELKIKELTLYAFSIENFNRPKEEFEYLMKIFRESFEKLSLDSRIHENRIRINIIGRIWMFPEAVQQKMREIMEKTRNYSDYTINFAMAYGGKSEVIDATKKIITKVLSGEMSLDQVNEETFKENLYLENEPDLIIRTGGDHRTSNFLIWQSAYSEWFFLEKTWPEFEKEDFVNALKDYSNRDRRFGK